jgi:hypothetical protein
MLGARNELAGHSPYGNRCNSVGVGGRFLAFSVHPWGRFFTAKQTRQREPAGRGLRPHLSSAGHPGESTALAFFVLSLRSLAVRCVPHFEILRCRSRPGWRDGDTDRGRASVLGKFEFDDQIAQFILYRR